jgi:hypothetical protein
VEKIGFGRIALEWVGDRREYPRPEQLHSPIVVGMLGTSQHPRHINEPAPALHSLLVGSERTRESLGS